jgi:hypothetical protein
MDNPVLAPSATVCGADRRCQYLAKSKQLQKTIGRGGKGAFHDDIEPWPPLCKARWPFLDRTEK